MLAECERLPVLGAQGTKHKLAQNHQRELLGPIKLLSFTVASWFRYLNGKDDQGKELPIIDPMSKKLRERALEGGQDPQSLLSMREVFSESLATSPRFVDQVRETLKSFYEQGARATLTKYIQT